MRPFVMNDIFDLSYKAIFILFVWDYRQLFGLSWWKSFCRTIIMFWMTHQAGAGELVSMH